MTYHLIYVESFYEGIWSYGGVKHETFEDPEEVEERIRELLNGENVKAFKNEVFVVKGELLSFEVELEKVKKIQIST